MNIIKGMTPVYTATITKGTNAQRWQRAVYVDLLPPCNNACPAGLNIQAWLGLTQAGRYEEAWRKYMEDNPLPAIHGRACYHGAATGKRVLVVGSGPAGLSCAYHLRRLDPPRPQGSADVRGGRAR
jgi:formate dehydrogenase (NADP+) beta subunit